jgi:hypothetical protein
MKKIQSFLEHTNETSKIIEDSYNDYIIIDNDREREIMARHIARTAIGFIKNRDSKIEDWMEAFKNEDIVMNLLYLLN